MTPICTDCAHALTNDDDSVWEDHTPEGRAALAAAVESLGWVTLVPHEFPGYFECFICSQIDIHDGYTTA